jgi:anti-sigma factor RsiW
MICDDVQDRLSEYLDKRLDGESNRSVEEHLSSCSNCRSVFEALSHTVRLLAAELEVEPPFGMRTRVMASLDEAQDKRSIWHWSSMPFRISIPIQAASVVVIAVLAVLLYNQQRSSDEMAGKDSRLAGESRRKTDQMAGRAEQGEAGQGSPAQEAAINYQFVVRVSASDTPVVPSSNRSRALFRLRRISSRSSKTSSKRLAISNPNRQWRPTKRLTRQYHPRNLLFWSR